MVAELQRSASAAPRARPQPRFQRRPGEHDPRRLARRRGDFGREHYFDLGIPGDRARRAGQRPAELIENDFLGHGPLCPAGQPGCKRACA